MNKLNELIDKCTNGVYVTVNSHKDFYQTVMEFIVEMEHNSTIEEIENEITKEVLDEMVKQNKIIQVQFYPHTAIGSYTIYHYDINKALDICLSLIK